MKLPTVPTKYDDLELYNIKEVLIAYIKNLEQHSLAKSDIIPIDLLNSIPTEIHSACLKLGIFHVKQDRVYWTFKPLFVDGMLIFSDWDYYVCCEDYVFVTNNPVGCSYRFSVANMSKGHILDLGTGSGMLSLICCQENCHALGIDINQRAIQIARFNKHLNGKKNVFFEIGDYLKFDSSKYEMIVSHPPFEPFLEDIKQPIAFCGGGNYGLSEARKIIRRFAGKANLLSLYLHTLESPEFKTINILIEEAKTAVKAKLVKCKFLYSYPIQRWYDQLLKSNRAQVDNIVWNKKKFKHFTKYSAYFLFIRSK